MAQGEKHSEQLTENEKELIRILRNHKDGAKAFEIALNIIIAEIENEQKNKQ